MIRKSAEHWQSLWWREGCIIVLKSTELINKADKDDLIHLICPGETEVAKLAAFYRLSLEQNSTCEHVITNRSIQCMWFQFYILFCETSEPDDANMHPGDGVSMFQPNQRSNHRQTTEAGAGKTRSGAFTEECSDLSFPDPHVCDVLKTTCQTGFTACVPNRDLRAGERRPSRSADHTFHHHGGRLESYSSC